jgi:hypothetical protein
MKALLVFTWIAFWAIFLVFVVEAGPVGAVVGIAAVVGWEVLRHKT